MFYRPDAVSVTPLTKDVKALMSTTEMAQWPHLNFCIHQLTPAGKGAAPLITAVWWESILLLKPQLSSGMCRWCDGSGRGWLGVVDTRLSTESRPELETVNK